jgi:glucose-1-phosphate adenylyltransferase
VKNSLVANGCVIKGSVENCILFRGAYVGAGTRLKNSIVMSGSEINDDSEMEYCVIDKNVSVRNSTRLIGNEQFPVIIRKGAVV